MVEPSVGQTKKIKKRQAHVGVKNRFMVAPSIGQKKKKKKKNKNKNKNKNKKMTSPRACGKPVLWRKPVYGGRKSPLVSLLIYTKQ